MSLDSDAKLGSGDDTKNLVEVWKKIVDVQVHFNDIEMRIRNLALTVIGAFAGIAATVFKLSSNTIPDQVLVTRLSTILLLLSFVVLAMFYFMDRFWYHRLLDGSVKAGQELESQLTRHGLGTGLGISISKASAIVVKRKKIRSADKIDIFYGAGAMAILLLLAYIHGIGYFVGVAVISIVVAAFKWRRLEIAS